MFDPHTQPFASLAGTTRRSASESNDSWCADGDPLPTNACVATISLGSITLHVASTVYHTVNHHSQHFLQ